MMSNNNNKKLNAIQSIYIPCVLPNITADFIKATIEFQQIGIVSRVDVKQRNNNDDDSNCNMAFVHLTAWCNNPFAYHVSEALKKKNKREPIKIAYNKYGNYWMLLPFNKKNKNNTTIRYNLSKTKSFKQLVKQNEDIISKIRTLNETYENERIKELEFKINALKEKLSIQEMELNDQNVYIPDPPVLKRQTARSYDNLPILNTDYYNNYENNDPELPASPPQSLVTQEDYDFLYDEESDFDDDDKAFQYFKRYKIIK